MDGPLDGTPFDQAQHGLAARTFITIDLVTRGRPLDINRYALDIAFNAAWRRAHGRFPAQVEVGINL